MDMTANKTAIHHGAARDINHCIGRHFKPGWIQAVNAGCKINHLGFRCRQTGQRLLNAGCDMGARLQLQHSIIRNNRDVLLQRIGKYVEIVKPVSVYF
ncbi:hypothetical protein D3C75_882720 [compost metagenome]